MAEVRNKKHNFNNIERSVIFAVYFVTDVKGLESGNSISRYRKMTRVFLNYYMKSVYPAKRIIQYNDVTKMCWKIGVRGWVKKLELLSNLFA